MAAIAGLVIGELLDIALGDPARGHPVAGFGRIAASTERAIWADDRARGVVFAAGLVGGVGLLAWLADRRTRRTPAARVGWLAAVTWSSVGGTSLAREAQVMARLLSGERVEEARDRLSHLCGRDASLLDATELARATIESVAENTSDAVVAPLFWGAVAGPAGIAAYRAANTLDAMVGNRTSRYERFGWASARLDDLANLLPARLTAALAVGLAPVVGGSRRASWAAWRDDAAGHPSPNAGPVEAAFAGALGIRLGGSRNVYGDHADVRPSMGNGPDPGVGDIRRAIRLQRAVTAGTVAVCALIAAAGASRSPTHGFPTCEAAPRR